MPVLALVGVGAVVLGIMGLRWVAESKEAERAAAQNEKAFLEEARATLEASKRQVREDARQRERIAGATFRTQRLAALDGQCLGKGLPKFGYVVEGSTYADNVLVGRAVSCEPFGGEAQNVTNWFCCVSDNLRTNLKASMN